MKPGALIGNLGWLAASLPEYGWFRRDVHNCEQAQRKRLALYLSANAHTEFGREHGFVGIHSWEEFARRVPLRTYDDFSPWIERIAAGNANVLTHEPVRLFEPSSGSSGPAKWIPFTDSLQQELRRAVAVWAAQTFLSHPALLGGPAYWSLTPQISRSKPENSVIPVGFEDDSAYLGGLAQRLISRTQVTRPALARLQDMQAFWRLTLLMLLQSRDLRLISIWHPSYLELLINRLRENWSDLLEDLASGLANTDPSLQIRPQPTRSRELESCGHSDLHKIWPHLGLISCWTDAHAANGIQALHDLFPRVQIQEKGLVATEAFVTIPLDAIRPLAIRSHFFEFLGQDERLFAPWELETGGQYSVVITTAGGLYRYRLGDRVEVNGFLGDTPCLRFLGKQDRVVDFYGEKLNEQFVAGALGQVLDKFTLTPSFALLAMEETSNPPAYVLYIQTHGEVCADLARELDNALGANPHYALCRRLGQLGQVRACRLSGHAFEDYSRRMLELGMRMGDIKPTPLSQLSGWRDYFTISLQNTGDGAERDC
jgi:hypothetical protein